MIALFFAVSILWYWGIHRILRRRTERFALIFAAAAVSGTAALFASTMLVLLTRAPNGWEWLGATVLSACHLGTCAVLSIGGAIVRSARRNHGRGPGDA